MNTLRNAVALVTKTITALALLAPLAMLAYVGTAPMTPFAGSEQIMATEDGRAMTEGSAAQVIATSDCVAPEGDLPSSVVVDTPASDGWVHLKSDRAVGRAFEQLVFDGVLEGDNGVDHDMRVATFCR